MSRSNKWLYAMYLIGMVGGTLLEASTMSEHIWSFGVVPRLGTMMVLLVDLEALEMAKRCESQLSIEIAEDNVEESARLLRGRVESHCQSILVMERCGYNLGDQR